MAERPVYCVSDEYPYYRRISVSFDWNGGFAISQKQKNIKAMHQAYHRLYPGRQVLEISSKSMQEHGEDLSAFFLKKFVPELGKSVPVECAFQGGKVFLNGGPYKDLLLVTPREAKRDERLKTSGRIVSFTFDGRDFPTIPETFFYDWLYINALAENPELQEVLLGYDAFTDVEFNPEKSLNCQAKAAAVFVSLSRLGMIERTKDPDEMLKLYGGDRRPAVRRPAKPAEKKAEAKIGAGMKITHKAWGTGTVTEVGTQTLEAEFPGVGKKKLGLSWAKENCRFTE